MLRSCDSSCGFVEGPGSLSLQIYFSPRVGTAPVMLTEEAVNATSLWSKLCSLPHFPLIRGYRRGSYFSPLECFLDTEISLRKGNWELPLHNICKVCCKWTSTPLHPSFLDSGTVAYFPYCHVCYICDYGEVSKLL